MHEVYDEMAALAAIALVACFAMGLLFDWNPFAMALPLVIGAIWILMFAKNGKK